MAWRPHAIIEERVLKLADEHQVPLGTVTSILAGFVKALHEVSHKSGSTEALLGVYFTLGDEAAWHFFGTVHCAYKGADNEALRDAQDMWNETAQRLDHRMARFTPILNQWEEERALAKGLESSDHSTTEDSEK